MPLPNFDEQARAAGSTLNYVGTNDQELDSDQYPDADGSPIQRQPSDLRPLRAGTRRAG